MTRKELICKLTDDMVDTLEHPEDNEGYAASICREGFAGFNNMPTDELKDAYRAAFDEEPE